MTIFINDKVEIIKDDSTTVGRLLEERNISSQGTAVACNGSLVPRAKWDSTPLMENDRLTIISAAYGG